jgi:glycopeptide antibiotics resistance protein
MNSINKIILIIVFGVLLFGNKAAAQSAGSIVRNEDPCNGTGGNGQIVSVGNSAFTLRRNDNGSNQIVKLSRQTIIRTATGPVSLADLKIGDMVTLVGDVNSDGSFTATTIVVCKGIQQNEAALETQSGRKTIDLKKINKWNFYINASVILFIGLIWIAIVTFLRLNKKKSIFYLLLFTIFYVYIVKVLDYTLFQFQSLILRKYFIPELMLKGQTVGKSINLIPLLTLTAADLKTSLLNILLMMPFGFGLPFLVNYSMKKIVIIGTLFSVAIELLQLLTGSIANITFRITDINDVIFNTIGVVIGYLIFIGFLPIYRRLEAFLI